MMKKRAYVPGILCMIVTLATIAACERENVEGPSPPVANAESQKPAVHGRN